VTAVGLVTLAQAEDGVRVVGRCVSVRSAQRVVVPFAKDLALTYRRRLQREVAKIKAMVDAGDVS
jgi:hypothetical protein